MTGASTSSRPTALSNAVAYQASSSAHSRSGSRSTTDAHQAHSFTSVARKSRSQGAAMAREAPEACVRATTPGICQPNRCRALSTRLRHALSNSSSIATPNASSTAPVEVKNRLLPVRRRESSKGNAGVTFSLRSPVPDVRHARRGSRPPTQSRCAAPQDQRRCSARRARYLRIPRRRVPCFWAAAPRPA